MPRQKILITVKTYPVLSTKYLELVCTAGFLEDGRWMRIYPVPFRKMGLEKQYQKYQWISVDVERNRKDPRPESHKVLNFDTMKPAGEMPTDKSGVWENRRKLILKKVDTSLKEIIDGAHQNKFSLSVFKPKNFIKFDWKAEAERNWDPKKIEALEADKKQLDIFKNLEDPFNVVQKVPYKFSYEFEDESGGHSHMMIEDWEIGALYWNCFKKTKDEKEACRLVKKKYWDDFVKTKETFLFLGTTKEFHLKKAPNPYVIVGVFPPKEQLQGSLL